MTRSTQTPSQMLAEQLMTANSDTLRGVTFHLKPESAPLPPLYAHQREALRHLFVRPTSTIVHLPTGSGKTRIALEFIAQIKRDQPHATLLWVSYPTTLIRQAMVRLAQSASLFSDETRFLWLKSDTKSRTKADLFAAHDIIFALRGTLTALLDDVGSRPSSSPMRAHLSDGKPLVVIYDECHQLGARRLQSGWRTLARRSAEGSSWPRILGLSATPLPRNPRRRILLRKMLFPLGESAREEPGYQWGMDVAYRVPNSELEELGVLCPINTYQQRSGFFDVPDKILDRATWRRPIEEPTEETTTAEDLLRFSGQFNARIMSHPLVLRFLAGRIATRIDELGKTLVFMPTIRAANALYTLLRAHPLTRDRVFIVHTRLDDLQAEDEAVLPVYPALARFAAMGNSPCVMINVEMLTTGFDDPKIQSIVLARLTFSMNLFWQMIGRGSRGPKSGGTSECTVIDPIRLTRLYPIADGYRPSLTGSKEEEIIDDDAGAGRLDPTLTLVERRPANASTGIADVDESYFDTVELDEEALTAYSEPARRARRTSPQQDEVHFDAAATLDIVSKDSLSTSDTLERLRYLLLCLEPETLQRTALAFGIPFAGTVARQDAADELIDTLISDGRKGISTLFGAIPAPELRRLARGLQIVTPRSRKAAFATSLIHCFLLSSPEKPLIELVAPTQVPRRVVISGNAYEFLDRHYDKRGLQRLLDALGEARSAKNKRILIRRIYETFLWHELAETTATK